MIEEQRRAQGAHIKDAQRHDTELEYAALLKRFGDSSSTARLAAAADLEKFMDDAQPYHPQTVALLVARMDDEDSLAVRDLIQGLLTLVSLLTLVAEISAVCIALQVATGVAFQWWGLPVVALLWGLLWRSNFDVIEKGVSLPGLVTVIFIVAAIREQPQLGAVAAGFVPALPPARRRPVLVPGRQHPGRHADAVSLLLLLVGRSEGWNKHELSSNRVVASFGRGFGAVLSAAVLIAAAACTTARHPPRELRPESPGSCPTRSGAGASCCSSPRWRSPASARGWRSRRPKRTWWPRASAGTGARA